MKNTKKEVTIEKIPGNRYIASTSEQMFTFEIEGVAQRNDILNEEYRSLYHRFANESTGIQMGNLLVPMWGEGHNLYPQEVFNVISENKLLPEILSKQVEFLFGKGPYLYTEQIVGEGKNQKKIRVPIQDQAIQSWLESWEENGYNSIWEYLCNIITDYYHVLSCISQYHFNKSARLLKKGITPPNGAYPIAALSYVPSDRARLACSRSSISPGMPIRNEQCTHIVVGDWLNPNRQSFAVYERFNPRTPFIYNTAISWVKSKTFTRDLYPYNDWFKGLYEWIKGSNLTPKYINSYLKNALNAHVHVVIPGTWYMKMKSTLEDVCRQNLVGIGVLQPKYQGVNLINPATNVPFEYYEGMMEQLISHKLREITKFLSGEGKNQGKLWASTKWGEEGWEFKEFPGKFKEYMEAVITYDKRADQVILAGKGISSSISNVENDGVISKSGSDVYYNFMIYAMSLTLPEHHVCSDLNRAIRINFPHAVAKGIKLGLQIEVPSKQQETAPADRPQNNIEN